MVIPVYQGEAIIGPSIDRLTAFLRTKPWAWEVIAVNDGSTDRTAAILGEAAARELRVRFIDAPHGGKGAAVKRGMLAARGQWRFMCDADLSMPPEQLDHFFSGEGGMPSWDVSIASREAAGSRRIGEPSRRHMSGRLFTNFVKLIALRGINDTQCGFKLFSAEAVAKTFAHQRLKGFGFDVEILFLTRRSGLTIGEVAIDWHYFDRSTMTFARGVQGFWEVLQVRLNHLMGRYRGVRRAP